MWLWSFVLAGCGSDAPPKSPATAGSESDADTDSDTDSDVDLDSADSGTSDPSTSDAESTSTTSPVEGRWVGDCAATSFAVEGWSARVTGWSLDLRLRENAGSVNGQGQQVLSFEVSSGGSGGTALPLDSYSSFDPRGTWDGASALDVHAIWYAPSVVAGSGTYTSSYTYTGPPPPPPHAGLSGTIADDTWTASFVYEPDPAILSGTCTLVRQ